MKCLNLSKYGFPKKSIAKSRRWIIFTTILGLTQLFICLLFLIFNDSVTIDRIFNDCVILFFCSTLIATSFTEYNIKRDETIEEHNFKNKSTICCLELFPKTPSLFLNLIPFIVIIISIAMYCGILTNFIYKNFIVFNILTCIVLIVSIIYSFIINLHTRSLKIVTIPKNRDIFMNQIGKNEVKNQKDRINEIKIQIDNGKEQKT